MLCKPGAGMQSKGNESGIQVRSEKNACFYDNTFE